MPVCRSRLLGAAAALSASLTLAGCGGSGRSAAAFCRTMRAEQHQILAQFHRTARAGSGGVMHDFAELGASVQAVGALNTYFQKLASVAPAPIEQDAGIVAKAYSKELNDMSNVASDPLGALGGALIDSMTSSYQLNAMNRFAVKNCGRGI